MAIKADNNVPFQANRPRFNIVGVHPSSISQAGTMNGKRPTTVAQPNPSLLDPAVSGGKAEWTALNNGGIFFLGGNPARPLIIDSMFQTGAAPTVKIVAINDPLLESAPTELRPWPGTFPVRLGPNECLSVSGAATKVGFIVRLDGQKVL